MDDKLEIPTVTEVSHDDPFKHLIGRSLQAPSVVTSVALTSSLGTSNFPAREDHVHDIDVTILDVFTSTLDGIVPASGGGTTNFLRADGTWSAPPGGGGISDGDKGDITVSSSGTVWTVDNDTISNAKLANVSTATIKGRVTAGSGDPEDLTGTQATTLLDVFTSSLKGLTPASGGGTTNFLRADGTWAAPITGGKIIVTRLSGTHTNATTTPTTLSGMSFTATNGKAYYFKVFGKFQSSATTAGLKLVMSGFSGSLAMWRVDIQQAAAGTDQNYQNAANGLSTALQSASVVAANTDYSWSMEGMYLSNATGTVDFQAGAEAAGTITIVNAIATIFEVN